MACQKQKGKSKVKVSSRKSEMMYLCYKIKYIE